MDQNLQPEGQIKMVQMTPSKFEALLAWLNIQNKDQMDMQQIEQKENVGWNVVQLEQSKAESWMSTSTSDPSSSDCETEIINKDASWMSSATWEPSSSDCETETISKAESWMSTSTSEPSSSDCETEIINEAESWMPISTSEPRLCDYELKIPKSVKFKVRGNNIHMNDGFTWRKYGEKIKRGAQYPRSYFKCAEASCKILKRTERKCDENGSVWVLVTYIGKHNHPQINSSDSSPLPSVQEEGVLDECAEFSVNPTSPDHAELIEAFNQAVVSDSQCSILQESKLPSSIPNSVASPVEPIESPDGTQLLLTLENTYLGESLFVGAVVHAIPSEILEFYFFNAKEMAICVGVGLPQAKVILHNDLSITIEETTISESELKDPWMPFLRDSSRHLVMEVNMEASDMQVNGDVHVQASVSERAETLSQLYGVGFDCGSQQYIVDETYDAAEVSWPLLYAMALFILKRNDVQCNETDGKSSSQGSGSFQGNNPDNNMVHKLHAKHNSVSNRGNVQGAGGDGNEDGLSCNDEEDDDPPVVLIVRVHPLPKFDILDTHVNPDGLDRACISPELVFEFRLNRQCRRISIKADTQLEVASQIHNTNLFGWYHTNIHIGFGCEDTQDSGRVALLKPNTCRILNRKTPYKYTSTNSIGCSKANTLTAGALGGLKIGSLFGSIDLQGSASASRMNQQTTSTGRNMEMVHECICEGFSFKNISLAESPARARFFLSYPLENSSIWADTEFLKNRGLFQTITPSIKATWIPLNEDDASPYSFKVERSLRLHQRGDELNKDHVLDHKQEYILSFLVNHAMTHLQRSRKNKPIDLYGDQQSVPKVLTVGAVY